MKLPEAICVPHGLNEIEYTGAVWPANSLISFPVDISHKWIEPSVPLSTHAQITNN